jgi:hypothetical protein
MSSDTEAFSDHSFDLPDSLKIDVKAVLSKVHLTDKPIIALFALHTFLLICSVLVRSHRFWRAIIFAICIAFAMVTEKVGNFLASRWQAFGFSANYFDENGVFLLFFFAFPPLFNCIFLFSHLVGGIGGRIVDRYLDGRGTAHPPPCEESTKESEPSKQKTE